METRIYAAPAVKGLRRLKFSPVRPLRDYNWCVLINPFGTDPEISATSGEKQANAWYLRGASERSSETVNESHRI